ncbi:MAG: beta-ketoacyl-ACP synthase, partial [Microvirga sp.]
VLLIYEMGGFLWKKPHRPVFERVSEGGGMILGSGAAFLVLESREHAQARGATAMARLAGVGSERSKRQPGSVSQALGGLGTRLGAKPDVVLSGATGVKGITDEEFEALTRLAPGTAIHATGDVIGHTMEGQAPAGVALAAALIAEGQAGEALVTSVGHWRGEGALRLTAA